MNRKLFCYFAVFFAIILISLVFVGCKNKDSAPVTLRIFAYIDETDSESARFNRIRQEFIKENPDVNLVTEILYGEEYHQKAVSRLAENDVPDIAFMGADARWGAPWQESGQQVDNLPYYPDFIDASLVPDFFGIGIKPYIPLGGSNYCTVAGINTELLKKIGGKIPENYDDLKELAALCQKNGIACITTHGADSWVWGSCILSAIVPRTTGDPKWIEKAIERKVNFTNQNFVAALDAFSAWVEDGVLNAESVYLNDATGMQYFVDGKSLIYIDGQWAFGENNLGALSKTVKLMSLPPIPNEIESQKGSLAGAWQAGYGITKKCALNRKVLEAAKKWLEMYLCYEETVQRLNDGDISAPIIKDFVTPPGMDPMIAEKAKLGAYPSCYVIDSYLGGLANDELNAGMINIVLGKATASEVAAKIQAAFNEM